MEVQPRCYMASFSAGWLGALTTAASLAKMTSITPTSGGHYRWVLMLATPKHWLDRCFRWNRLTDHNQPFYLVSDCYCAADDTQTSECATRSKG